MKLMELFESLNSRELARITSQLKNSSHVADVGDMNIRKLRDYYSIWHNDALMMYCILAPVDNNVYSINEIWVSPRERPKKLLSRVLKALTSRLRIKSFIIGNISDNYADEIVASHLFDKSVVNKVTGEKHL